jgi:beta-glucosidase
MRALAVRVLGICLLLLAASAPTASAQQAGACAGAPWMNARLSPSTRADLVLREMTLDEKVSMLHAVSDAAHARETLPIARLCIPALRLNNGSAGVGSGGPVQPQATALPAPLGLAASFDPGVAYSYGAVMGRETRDIGRNLQEGPDINIARVPLNGRTFEAYGEDPFLAGEIATGTVRGIQSEGTIAEPKHYLANNQEIDRDTVDERIDERTLHEIYMPAFETAVKQGRAGAVMCAKNKVNGDYACESAALLQGVLKDDWGFGGFVVSDFDSCHDTVRCAFGGLDFELPAGNHYGDPLKAAVQSGAVPQATLDDHVHRVLQTMFRFGLVDRPATTSPIDAARDGASARAAAEAGTVLLKNDGVLPLATDKPLKIAVIGGHAQEGVASGTGSGAVLPVGGYAAVIKIGGPGMMGAMRNLYVSPPSPLAELKKLAPKAQIEFDPGYTPAEAALMAKRSDVVIAFGIRVEGEGFDSADLSLPWGQDAVIEAVASVNPNTIVVLETGNPSSMPWRNTVKAIVQAWYPGQAGGQAIAEILTGTVNPSGRLPITFPADLAQTPRPELSGLGTPWGTPVTIRYDEGAEVGYRWYAQKNHKPMYPFGYGLSYTSFDYKDLTVSGGETVTATFTVTNTGTVAGADVPQVYLTDAAGERRMRLLGFERVELAPGASRTVTITADPRLLARFDGQANQWRIAPGTHRVTLAKSAGDVVLTAEAPLTARVFGQ